MFNRKKKSARARSEQEHLANLDAIVDSIRANPSIPDDEKVLLVADLYRSRARMLSASEIETRGGDAA